MRPCRCPHREPERYQRRVSGPLLDRIDLRVVMPRIDPDELVGAARPESSTAVAERIAHGWRVARERNNGEPNASLRGARLLTACAMDPTARMTARELAQALELTARGVHRMLRVARTVADLRGLERVSRDELLAASSMRDRSMEREPAA